MSDPEAEHGGAESRLARLLHSEIAGGVALLVCAVLALAWANSPWRGAYQTMLHTEAGVRWGDATFAMSLRHWVNDLLMVVFFFLVGLEIKRELVLGELSSVRRAILPAAAALGGMLVPAGIYAVLNADGPGAPGWGIPMATDIAFAVGILATLGRRVPVSLKIFLTALAIADDMGAVLVIAVFYTAGIEAAALGVAAVLLAMILLLMRAGARHPALHVGLGLGVWAAVFASGVHATVAGVLMAMTIPVRAAGDPERFWTVMDGGLGPLRDGTLSPRSAVDDHRHLEALQDVRAAAGSLVPPGLELEHRLEPVVSFLVLPLFALFNAGVAVGDAASLTAAVPLGVILGLVVGKPVGIVLCSWLAIRSGGARMPDGLTWARLLGLGLLAGVGFTMSLFIGDLAFADPQLEDGARLGILTASFVAGVTGWFTLAVTGRRPARPAA